MGIYFSGNYPGPAFEFLGAAHLVALGFWAIVIIVLTTRFRHASDRTKRIIRCTMAIILLVNEISYHIWALATGQWSIQVMLPLHLCAILVWTNIYMLFTKNKFIYEYSYFLGLAGSLQALLTPDVGIYGFPHFRFFQTFISHGILFTIPIYMTVVEGFRPTWKSMGKTLVGMNIYMFIVFIINRAIGSNYLFINYKPPTASLLDMLPPWPVYILYMELIGIVNCLVLYLPFAIKDWRTKRTEALG
jgi:hypothetical integral membrane protein (TIGR02206 family)